MAWELGNELRCGATDGRNLPRSPSGCTPALLTSWVDEMSTFIKSIDPHHLVTVGSEGQFNDPTSSDGFYNGGDGDDFNAQMALPNIDFGTFHTYPDWWSKTVQWANQWIIDHATAGKKAGKPVLHEEYGTYLRIVRRQYNHAGILQSLPGGNLCSPRLTLHRLAQSCSTPCRLGHSGTGQRDPGRSPERVASHEPFREDVGHVLAIWL